jgi:hypothetical protein
MWVMPHVRNSDLFLIVGFAGLSGAFLEEIMKSLLAMSALLIAIPAHATPVEQMVADGFDCGAATETQVICRKDGRPSKICNIEGSCFRIIYEGGLTRPDPVKTGSISSYDGLRN